jgi:hypothetical protein
MSGTRVKILLRKYKILTDRRNRAESFAPFVLRDLKVYGFWSMAHEMRTDFAMWPGSLFLLIKGGGNWSFDLFFSGRN